MMPLDKTGLVALGATRTSVAARLTDLANELALIARQCDQKNLFDGLMLDHLDRLAAQADKDANLCSHFAQDPNYEVD